MEPGSWKMVAGLAILVLMLVFASIKAGNAASATDRRNALDRIALTARSPAAPR